MPSTQPAPRPGDASASAAARRAPLLALVAEGAASAQQELCARYYRRSFAVAWSILGDERRAVDTVRDAGAGSGRVVPPGRAARAGQLASLLGSICRRSVAIRQNGRASAGPLGSLSDDECAVVALARYGRLSVGEIATQTGRSPDAVAALMGQALRTLAATLTASGRVGA